MIYNSQFKFLSVGCSIGGAFAFTISYFLPTWIPLFLLIYLVLAGVGIYNLKDELAAIMDK